MKVLYLCHRVPYPPNKGDKIRAFHQLRALGREHEVDLFALADEAADASGYQELGQYCRGRVIVRIERAGAHLRSLPYLLTRKPLTLPYFYASELSEKIRREVLRRRYDRIFVYCSAMAQYVEKAKGIPIITDLVDVDSNKWRQYADSTSFPARWIYGREAARLGEYEREVCRRSKCVLVTTGHEADLLRRMSTNANIHVLSNGVDTDFFHPPAVDAGRRQPAIVFTGDMRYFPNEEAVIYFARSVLPLIRRSVPEARFLIVGRDPTRRVKQLETVPGVEVTGYVPDVRAYLAKARVAVAPFRIAAGIQNKVLEALASGLPVVATPRAVQGLCGSVADIVQTGDSPAVLADRVTELLRKPQFAEEVGMEGRRRIMAEYNWRQSDELLLAIVREPDARASATRWNVNCSLAPAQANER